ncbi:hypothetical protein V499_03276 [Pseudogymnoascus sp. VKM F-103]|nr:hypothetical protein V499_03276 [Pseudogymnoascus sp. VKM F-103]
MAELSEEFVSSLARIGTDIPDFRWYLSAIVFLGAANYPEHIPYLYQQLLKHHIHEEEHFEATKALRESFTKASAIMGAARTGNAIRLLGTATLPHLKDTTFHRSGLTDDSVTVPRGKALHTKIYGQNVLFDGSRTVDASLDYAYVVRELFYGKIFSFEGILGFRETEQVIVAALIGVDCMNQVRHHMFGMRVNGVGKTEVEANRQICLAIAAELGIGFKEGVIEVPDVPE